MATYTAGEVSRAIELFDRLRDNWLDLADTWEQIIAERAWEPLGYETFFEAWDDKLSDIPLSRFVNVRAVYQMLAEGIDEDRIAMAVKGIGPETVRNIKRERENGVPPELATGRPPRQRPADKPIYVRPHGREKASPDSVIRVDVGPTMFIEYTRIAKKLGRSVPDIAKEAIAERFSQLAKVK